MIWDGPAATDGGEIGGGSDPAFEGTSGHGSAPGGDGESGDQGPTAAENGETGHAHAGTRESGQGAAATKDRDNKPQPAAPQGRKNRHGPTATQDRENKPQPTASQDRENRQGSAATRDREGGQGPDVGAPAAYRPGRAAASTIPMAAPQTRRFAVTVFLVALAVAVAGVVALVTWPHKTTVDARPSPTGTAATVGVPPEPLVTPSAPASTPPAPAVSPTPKLIFADAVGRMRSAVEDGAADGEIRADVATDLLNLIRPLSAAEGENVNTQVDQLRRKISERLGEGSLAPGQADLLRSRLADLDRAAGT